MWRAIPCKSLGNDKALKRRAKLTAPFSGGSRSGNLCKADHLKLNNWRALGELPRSLVVYKIEGKNFAAGVGLSYEIEKAASEAARQLLTGFSL